MPSTYYLGFNGFNQVPNNDSSHLIANLNFPNNPTDWKNLAVSWNTVCIITVENKLVFNGFIAEEINSSVLKELNAIDVAIGDKYLLIITETGFGKIFECQNENLIEIKQIELHKDRLLKCCLGDSGALFINEAGKVVWVSLKPKVEEYLLPIAWKIVEISCGKEHSLLLNENGTVYSFGQGSRGQLGNGTIESETNPSVIEHLEGIPVSHISAGGFHSAAVTTNGDLYTWGWNESGQLGFPTTRKTENDVENQVESVSIQVSPSCVNFGSEIEVALVSCGSRHTLVVTKTHQLWSFGWNGYGQLGLDGSTTFISKPTLVQHPFMKQVADVRCAGWCSLVLASS